MTLGPDRLTRLRWSMQHFSPSDGDGGGTPKADGDKGGNVDPKGETPPKSDDDSSKGDKKDDKRPKEDVVVKIDGKQYVLQDHVNDLVGTARQEGHNAGKKSVEDEARQKALEEQGNFKELFEQEKTKREAAERERDEANLKALRRSVGAQFGLSERLSDRLQGKNEKELKADAEEIAKEQGIKKPEENRRKAPDTESGNGSKVRQRGGDDKSDGTERKPRRPFAFQTDSDVKRWTE